jgi:uncharacterized SAM-binding protein YcdF (DUF218 family)
MFRERAIGVWFRRAVIAALITVLIGWFISLCAVIYFSSRDNAQPAEAIVVLGAAQYAGHPSPVLKARLDHALELWERHLARTLILTGGRGIGDTTSEAAVASRYAERRGVPHGAILLEDKGRTTRESMEGVAEILKRSGYKSAILVSDPFHMLRLRVLAGQMGFTPFTSPTQTSPISPNREERWRYILSESLKVPFVYFFERSM